MVKDTTHKTSVVAPKVRAQENQAIREAVLQAVALEKEKAPFALSGRGHEARVTLDISLAQILRDVQLPVAHISGYGANAHYPARVFDTARRILRKRLRWSPIERHDAKVYRASRRASSPIRSSQGLKSRKITQAPTKPRKKGTPTRSKHPIDQLPLTESLLQRQRRKEVLGNDVRLKLFSDWIETEPWAVGIAVSKVHITERDLVRLAEWLLNDEVTRILRASWQTRRDAVERFVSWVLRATKPDCAFFTTPHFGWVVNTFGPAHHRPGAKLAQAVEASAEGLGLSVGDELRVPQMPFLERKPLAPKREPTLAERIEAMPTGIWIVLSYINDWEVGAWASNVPEASTFIKPSEALTAFKSHQRKLDAQARAEFKKVRGSDLFIAEGGFDVINVLFLVPFTQVTNTTPPAWELLDDTSSYVVDDGCHSVDYSSGATEGVWDIDDVNLHDYLPPPADILPKQS